MDEEIRLITLRNLFDKSDRESALIPYEQKTLLDLRNEYAPNDPDLDFVVSINGQVVPEDLLALSVPQKGDCVVFTPKIKAAAIEAFLVAILNEALALAVPLGIIKVATFIIWTGMLIGAGLLINSMFAPAVEEVGTGDPGSQLYSWNPATTQQQGKVVPKMYGTSMVYGNIISINSETVGDNSFANILISLNLGPVNRIYGFKINDQDYGLFKNVTIETRRGYINQPAIRNFNDTKIEFTMARLLTYGTIIEYETTKDDFDGIEVEISFLNGLFKSTDTGVTNYTVNVRVQAICVEDPSIILLLTQTVSTFEPTIGISDESYFSLGTWVTDNSGNPYWKEFDRTYDLDAHYEGERQTVYISDYMGYPGEWEFPCTWKLIEIGGTVSDDYDIYTYAICTANTTTKKTFAYSSPITRKGKYIIRAERLSADTSDPLIHSEVSLSCVRLVYNDDFSYPRHTLVGIKALATDQLSGSLGFSCMLEGSLVRVYSGAVWSVEFTNNPAWVCYDILTQPVFGDPSYVYVLDSSYHTKWFRCKLGHTSDSSNHPEGSTGSTYWNEAETPFEDVWYNTAPSYFPIWADDTYYSVDTVVSDLGLLYRCFIAHTSTPGNRPSVSGAVWVVQPKEYFTDDYVVKHGTNYRYRCILGHESDASKEPGTSGGAAYWADCQWYTGTSYKSLLDSGIVRYDGINPSKLDHDAFKLWADFCDALVDNGAGGTEKRFEFNGGFDSEFTLWEAALRVCQMSRAMLYWNGNQISVVIDQASTPVQLFTSGNIIADSFEETFMPFEDRAGEIEISFVNRENNYEKDTFTIFNTTLDKPTNKAALQLLGVTKPSQAWRMGQFLLLCNQYLKRTITFKADMDAIACTIGDVINFQHDVPQWGLAGGRIVSATANSVTLDKEVTIEAGHSYSIMIRLSTDVLVTKTITNTPGTYSTLTVSTPFTVIPTLYDVYSFGIAGVITKPFRVQAIERANDLVMTISCIEYDENIYTVDTGQPVIPDIDYTPYDPISPVTDLLLDEVIYFDRSSNLIREITITFKKPSNILYKEAIIYYAKNNSSLVQAGVTSDTQFTISGCAPLDVYRIYICSRSWSGVTLNSSEWVTATITISSEVPEVIYITDYTVLGLEIYNQGNGTEFTGKDCKFVWRPVTAVIESGIGAGEEDYGAGNNLPYTWFKDFEVQIYSVYGALRRTEYTTAPEYTYTYEKNCEDSSDGLALYTFQIRVKARDLLGHISATAATLTVTNSVPNSVENLQALPVISGVCFTWNKSADTDFNCYYVRTAVESVYGDWKKVTDNAHTRSLSDAEMVLYGATALITIDVQAMDVFEQVSESVSVSDNAATISDNLFQFLATKSGGVGNVSDLYDGKRNIFVDPGVVI